MKRHQWRNWFGNQSCAPIAFHEPSSEADVQAAIAQARREGLTVRVTGSGHSLPPVVNTDGLLIDLSKLAGGMQIDVGTKSITAAAGIKLSAMFDPLWNAGLAMKNMGELADSTIAGAVGTGAHGTGHALQCTSAEVTGLRLVTASEEVLQVDETTPDLLRAAKVSVGMLGVVTQVTLSVTDAYDLFEQQKLMVLEDVLDEWDALFEGHRHFSFFYFATEAAGVSFATALPHLPDNVVDRCYATKINALAPGDPTPNAEPEAHHRRDRMNRILTVEFDPNYREIEYAVPKDVGKETFLELRDMVRRDHPEYAFPINVRILGEDDAYLSAYNGGTKYVFSVSEDLNKPWEGVLSKAEALFQSKGGLPHWGKEHALTKQSARDLFQDFDKFNNIRRELDPDGIFLNEHLREIFG